MTWLKLSISPSVRRLQSVNYKPHFPKSMCRRWCSLFANMQISPGKFTIEIADKISYKTLRKQHVLIKRQFVCTRKIRFNLLSRASFPCWRDEDSYYDRIGRGMRAGKRPREVQGKMRMGECKRPIGYSSNDDDNYGDDNQRPTRPCRTRFAALTAMTNDAVRPLNWYHLLIGTSNFYRSVYRLPCDKIIARHASRPTLLRPKRFRMLRTVWQFCECVIAMINVATPLQSWSAEFR